MAPKSTAAKKRAAAAKLASAPPLVHSSSQQQPNVAPILTTTIPAACPSESMSETNSSTPTSATTSTSGVSNSSSDSLNSSQASASADGPLGENEGQGRTSVDSKRRASKKKNQKRRDAGKKNKARLFLEDGATEGSASIPQAKDASSTSPNPTPSDQSSSKELLDLATVSIQQTVVNAESNAKEVDPVQEDISDKAAPIPKATTPKQALLDTPAVSEELQATLSPIGLALKFDQTAVASNHDIWALATPASNPLTAAHSNGQSNGAELQLNDAMWEGPGTKDSLAASNIQENSIQADITEMPGIQTRSQSRSLSQFAPTQTSYIDNRRVISNESISNLPSWDVASETVARVAIDCLAKDKDMELSYVAILSAITVLEGKMDPTTTRQDEPIKDALEEQETKARIGGLYSRLIKIMTRVNVARGLAKETLKQGVMAPEALYLQLYHAIRGAEFRLQDEDHLLMCYFLLDCKKPRDALDCLNQIETSRWTSAVLRASISGHLYSKPRQLHEAEVLLDRYLHLRDENGQEHDRASKIMIRKWFKLQLDASRWEEIKAQYERRRARLVDAPNNIERFSADADAAGTTSKLTVQSLKEHQQQQSPTGQAVEHPRRGSTSSSSAASTTAPPHPSTEEAPDPVSISLPTKRSSFSFFPSFKFGSSSSNSDATNAHIPPTAPARISTNKRVLPSRIQVNRHLTVLDNGMLEECINHKQFDYGWKQVYEQMGPSLEDKDTAKIAMRLCKRAFLGHGGMGPNQPGSPNLTVRDMYFADDYPSREGDGSEYLEHGAVRQEEEHDKEHAKANTRQDPEIWEARAWAIYNKAMMNPLCLYFGQAGSGGSPTHASLAGSQGGSSASLTSPISAMAGTTSLAVFLHSILTVAVHSPEKSSRYLKAFKIYSMMRSDPLNQYQNQLRDPFVMTCMLKAIYDTVQILSRAQDQPSLPVDEPSSLHPLSGIENRRRSSSVSTINNTHAPPMTIGPLIDLAFEIYADMRNVGPIRHLPQLSHLAPVTPQARTPNGTSMSMFFQLSNRPPAATSAAMATQTMVDAYSSGIALSPSERPSFASIRPCILQELNPTLEPNSQARRLPTEVYLALLHLCVQLPVPEVSQKVVKTIIADMMTSHGHQPCNLDRHLAAAVQFYHDHWMCSDERRSSCTLARQGSSGRETSEDLTRDQCIFKRWMYESDEYIRENSAPSASSSIVDLHGNVNTTTDSLATTMRPLSLSSRSSTSMGSPDPDALTGVSNGLGLEGEDEGSHYGISKHDADLDELDQYLGEMAKMSMDGMDQDTCNDRYYWDLWTREDPVLQTIRFTRRKARMLWRHVGQVSV